MSSDQSTSIDVGSWFTTLARNWWVIVGLIVIGIVVGAVVTMAQPKEYTATSSVYIGQTTDANGNPMAGLNSNAKAAVQLLASQVVLEEAAQRSGMDISASLLRKETSVETPSSTVKTSTSVVNIVVISVTDTDKERAAAAANALAEVLAGAHRHRAWTRRSSCSRSSSPRPAPQLAAVHSALRRRREGPRGHRPGQRLGIGQGHRLGPVPDPRAGGGHRAGSLSRPVRRTPSGSSSSPRASSSHGYCTRPACPTRRAARA